jgi:simple sugar transport system ATP-binding protein
MMFKEIPPRSSRVSYVHEENLLELSEAEFEDERLTVTGINLNIRVGEVFGLAGLEGSGQKLLLQACAGLLQPQRGKIILDGDDVTRFSYHQMQAASVAYLPAGRLEEGLVAGLSLTEHVALASPQRGFVVDWNHFEQITQAQIEKYQIVGRPETLVHELSGGNQQRALFALLQSPLKLLLLEHPTRGLDVLSAQWIWELLINRVEDGSSILFYSADLDELVERSDRIAAFSGGVMSRIVNATETTADELGHLIGGET